MKRTSLNKQSKQKISVTEKVTFTFGHYENAVNVSTALAMSGYYIKIIKDSGSYILTVYTDRI